MPVNPIIFVLSVLAGLFALIKTALKPKWFWPILIIISVGTGGIIIKSFGFLDEYLLACLLAGGLLAVSFGGTRLRQTPVNKWQQLHQLFFAAMIIYMIFQSARGLIAMQSLRKIRWVVYFSLLGINAFLISKRGFPIPCKRKLASIITLTGLGYFVLYFIVGLIYEILLKGCKWNLQNVYWGGTTYAFFPLVIIIPAVLFLTKDKAIIYRWVSWLTLLMAATAAFYYESRASWLVILAFFVIALPVIGWRQLLILTLIFLLAFWAFMVWAAPQWFNLKSFSKILFQSTKFFWQPAQAYDVGRIIHLKIIPHIITTNWQTFLFGRGFRMSGPLIGPNLAKFYLKYGEVEKAAAVANYQATIGLSSLVIETGLVGLLLLLTNFFFVGRYIYLAKENPYRHVLLLSLMITFSWLLITNVLDIVLFYLMIMPSGLLIQLSKIRQSPSRIKLKHQSSGCAH